MRDGRDGEGIDVAGGHLGCSGLHGGDGDEPGAGGEIKHAPPPHRLGMVQDVAGERLSSRPGKSPEGRRQADLAQFLLGLLPQLRRLVGHMERDLRRVGHRAKPGLGADEGDRVHDHAASMAL